MVNGETRNLESSAFFISYSKNNIFLHGTQLKLQVFKKAENDFRAGSSLKIILK
jgi:hypothetical protein